MDSGSRFPQASLIIPFTKIYQQDIVVDISTVIIRKWYQCRPCRPPCLPCRPHLHKSRPRVERSPFPGKVSALIRTNRLWSLIATRAARYWEYVLVSLKTGNAGCRKLATEYRRSVPRLVRVPRQLEALGLIFHFLGFNTKQYSHSLAISGPFPRTLADHHPICKHNIPNNKKQDDESIIFTSVQQ